MSMWTSLFRSPIVRVLYNHNPFYVISAALVLYGLQVSFAGSFQPTQGWLLLKLLGGYTCLLALAGIVIVRLGNVWEDARTVVLTTLLLLIALSSSFDRICLDSTRDAIPFLACGLGGAMALTEIMPRALGVQLKLAFRLLLHAHWVLFFTYPVLLGHLSMSDRETWMSWLVLLFPTWGALLFLPLVPLVHRENRAVTPNGTPWHWPWYPAPLFMFLAAGYVVRGYGISAAFELDKGYAGGFQGYFAIPLLLVGSVLLWELSRLRHRRLLEAFMRWMPVGLIALAMPGPGHSAAHIHFLAMLTQSIGAPVVITIILLLAYYSYLYGRGERRVTTIVIGLLLFGAFVDHDTVGWTTLRTLPHPSFTFTMGAILCAIGIRRGQLSYIVAGAAPLLMVMAPRLNPQWTSQQICYVVIHGTILAAYGLSLLYRDSLSRWIYRTAPRIVNGYAPVIACLYPLGWGELRAVTHAWLLVVLVVLTVLHWWWSPTLRRLLATFHGTAWLSAMGLGHAALVLLRTSELHGIRFLLGGMLLLSVGVIISLVKGDGYRRLLHRLHRFNQRRRYPCPDPFPA